MESSSPGGFLGIDQPPRHRKGGSVIGGPPGAFFKSIIKSSCQVELYDEELGGELSRRGISTEIVVPGKAAALFRSLRRRGVFALFAGYDLEQILGEQDFTEEILFVSSRLPKNEKKWCNLSLVAGVRPGRPGSGQVPILTARMIVTGKGIPRLKRFPPSSLIILDPLVMEPSLFPAPGNLEPGGLPWYGLTALLRKIFTDCRPEGAILLPCRLPRRDPLPSFILARVMAKIIAYRQECS